MIFNALDTPVGIRSFRNRLGILHLPSTGNTLVPYNTFVDGYDVFN